MTRCNVIRITLFIFAISNVGCGIMWMSAGNSHLFGINYTFSSSGVQAAYTIASDWNTFVKRSNTSQLCTGAETSLTACIHGGETRNVVTYETTCTGLTLTDQLNVFNWTCSIQNGVAVFTSSLQDGKGLVNLVSLSAGNPVWNSDSVTLSKSGSYTMTSPSAVWWNQGQLALLPDSSGGVVTLGAAYTGKVLTTSSTLQITKGYLVTTSNVAVLVVKGQKLQNLGTVNNCNTNTLLCVVSFEGTQFGWFEGDIVDGNGQVFIGVNVRNSTFCHIRNYRGSGFGGHAIELNGSSYTVLDTLTLAQSVSVISSSSNYMTYLNGGSGIVISTNSRFNTVQNAVFTGSTNVFQIAFGSNANTFVNITIATTNVGASDLLYLTGNAVGNIFHSILIVNNTANSGLRIDGSNQNTFSQIAIYSTSSKGILSNNGSTNNAWFGNLQLGNNGGGNCNVTGADGLVNGTCANAGSSAATFFNGFSANPFKGNVSDATQNSIDGGSVLAGNVINDSVSFDSIFRTWAYDAAFGVATQGSCVGTLSTCWVWDWSISSADTTIYNLSNNGGGGAANNAWVSGGGCISEVDSSVASNVITSVGACSNGVSTTSVACTGGGSTWYPPRTYLKNAFEITNDGTGSMDGLCEAGNSCQYMPNFGIFQGVSPLTSCSYKNSGALVPNVQMVGSSTPGI